MPSAKKVMVIGIDAANAPQMYKYAQGGHMPRVKRLLDNGKMVRFLTANYPDILSEFEKPAATEGV